MKHFYFWFLSLLAPMATMAETHEYVDLGLPSKTLWATTNIGASSPEGFGYYVAWGETTTKSTYSWSNYQYCSGTMVDDPSFTAWCRTLHLLLGAADLCGVDGFPVYHVFGEHCLAGCLL